MTERSRSSVRAWNTTPSRRSASPGEAATSWPSTSIRPARTLNSLVTSENSVVLPAPFSPRRAAKRDCGTAKPTPSSALRVP